MRNLFSHTAHPIFSKIFFFALSLLLLIASIVAFVPLLPDMPALVDSEKFAMNYAVSHHIAIGKEVIYLYGPYSSVYTAQYYPLTDFKMVMCSLYLAISFWISLVFIMKGAKAQWPFVLFLALSGLIYYRDVLLLSIPFLVGLVIYKAVTSQKDDWLVNSKYSPIYICILFFPLGLLPLTKGTILLTCAAVTLWCSLYLIINKQKILSAVCVVSPIISMLIFWVIADQSLSNLYSYLLSMSSFISGYSYAMSLVGEPLEIDFYLCSSALIMLSIYVDKRITQKLFLSGIYFIFLFISFKGGFVRHDHHALLAGTSLLIASLIIPFTGVKSKLSLVAMAFGLISAAYIDGNYIRTTPISFLNSVKINYGNAVEGLTYRLASNESLVKKYEESIRKIREKVSFPELQGSADIYSYNQAYIFVHGYSWAPRPAYQSHAAYSYELAEINRKYLKGPNAPDNIIFGVEPIDGRIPSSEDGASWPILLTKYTPSGIHNNYLFLKKNSVAESPDISWQKSRSYLFNQNVELPKFRGLIFTKITLKPSLLGKIKNTIFKTSALVIQVNLKDGTSKQFRIVPGMAEAGLMISPLIENTEEFRNLYLHDLLEKEVRSFSIFPADPEDWEN